MNRIFTLFLALLLASSVSCSVFNRTKQTASDIEQIERDGADIMPNVDHGQREAGRNAARFQESSKGYRWRDDRDYRRCPKRF